MGIEYREVAEIRSKDAAQGIVEAYLTRWDTVDSYQSTFKRGAFKESFEKRGPKKIRLLWNHRDLAGKVLECREDDYGPYVKVKFNLRTTVGKDAFAHVDEGDVDCFSFGFNCERERMREGVREIFKADCGEVSPVIFEANGEAKIMSVRAAEFGQTLEDDDIGRRGHQLISALMDTLSDVVWENPQTEWIPLTAQAIEDFRAAYLEWLEAWLARYGASEERSIPAATEMSRALYEASGGDLGDMAMRTAFTLDELRTLRRGELLEPGARRKLHAHAEIDRAHREARSARIEALCDEIRTGGLTTAEAARISGLIQSHPPMESRTQKPAGDPLADMIDYFEQMG